MPVNTGEGVSKEKKIIRQLRRTAIFLLVSRDVDQAVFYFILHMIILTAVPSHFKSHLKGSERAYLGLRPQPALIPEVTNLYYNLQLFS